MCMNNMISNLIDCNWKSLSTLEKIFKQHNAYSNIQLMASDAHNSPVNVIYGLLDAGYSFEIIVI